MRRLTERLGIPFLFGRKKEVEKRYEPREQGFLLDIYYAIERDDKFSLVYIDVVKGDAKYISSLVGGKFTSPKQIGVMVPLNSEKTVYDRLSSLDDAVLRVGVSHREKDETRGQLLVKAQHNYELITYCRPIMTPSEIVPAFAGVN